MTPVGFTEESIRHMIECLTHASSVIVYRGAIIIRVREDTCDLEIEKMLREEIPVSVYAQVTKNIKMNMPLLKQHRFSNYVQYYK
jgi:predicted transcriptional regulator